MLISTLENVLNRGLPRSPRARELCKALAGHRIAVDVTGVTRVQLESVGEALRLTRDATTPAEAEIVGGPISLMSLARAEPEAALQRGDVEIRGDVELAQKFRELVLLLRPDIEDDLARLLGDVPAHEIGRLARAVFGWTRNAASTTVRNLAEYLAHERQHLVPRAEADQLLQGVDELRENVDRLEARIQLLQARSQTDEARGAPEPDRRKT